MDRPWFDSAGNILFDEYVVNRPSFQRIIQDAVVTDDEIAEQSRKVVDLLRNLEQLLSSDAKAVATDALCELAVLNALQLKRLESV
jgi:hypothetical protein